MGGRFKVHQDSSLFHPRLITALFYLNDIEHIDSVSSSGGTWFPYASEEIDISPASKFNLTVEEAINNALTMELHQNDITSNDSNFPILKLKSNGLVVLPVKGDAIIFFNHREDDGAIDPSAIHAGLPLQDMYYNANSESVLSENGENKTPEHEKWVANYWVGLDRNLLLSE